LHPQLKRLWSLHQNLTEYAVRHGVIAASKAQKQTDNLDELAVLGMDAIAAEWEEYGFRFLPLVHKNYCLACSLDILFLRKGGPGHLVTNGDLDGRIKTLFDALQKPQQKNECGGAIPTEDENPFFCLLENDKLISEIKVTTDQLLDYEGRFLPNSSVHLVIGVKLTPTRHTVTNWIFQ
jgi:hypothetical protein